MTPLPSKFSGERWMLWRDRLFKGGFTQWYVGDDGDPMLSDPHCFERVEVMPVSELDEAVDHYRRAQGIAEEAWAAAEGDLKRLREAAQATFDAAGNGEDNLGVALVNLGLVLAGEEPNP